MAFSFEKKKKRQTIYRILKHLDLCSFPGYFVCHIVQFLSQSFLLEAMIFLKIACSSYSDYRERGFDYLQNIYIAQKQFHKSTFGSLFITTVI